MSVLVKEVTKLYGAQKALDNVSFSIKTGEIVGFLGPNGAGKSTMMKIITGFIPASSGTVYVNDTEISSAGKEIRNSIGYLPENNPLYPEMYIKEYLFFVASFYRLDKPAAQAVAEIIEVTGLAPEQNKKIGALSKGYRQRVGLAQALIHSPSVLILDEATTGLDPNQISEIRSLIREAGKNKTILLSTHIMQEVEAICDRIIIIDHGVIVADDEKSGIYSRISRQRQIVTVEFDRDPDEGLLMKAAEASTVKKIKTGLWIIESESSQDIRPLVFSFAVENKLTVLSLQKQESNLEEVFRSLTS
jgi:ABC-2 type transport system ATP-binding protein